MAMKSFRFPVTIGVSDPKAGTPEIRDTDGRLITPAFNGIRHIPPGEPVEMDEAEGNRLLAKTGPCLVVEVAPLGMHRQTLGTRRA